MGLSGDGGGGSGDDAARRAGIREHIRGPYLQERIGRAELVIAGKVLRLSSVVSQISHAGGDLRRLQLAHAQLLGKLQQSHVAG
jgi:hypothetical protein